MRVYKCDSCGVEIKEPHKVGMKEFCLSVSNCDIWQVFMPTKNRKKVHLCKECYRGLYILAKRQDLQLVKTNDVLFRKIKKEKCNHYRKIGGIGHCTCQKLFAFCDCKGNKAKCDYYEENRVQRFQVVIADDNIFVICPIVYDEKEKSDIVKYDKAEIYANQDTINTLKDLNFKKISEESKGVEKNVKESKLKPCPLCGGEAVVYHQSSKYATCDGNYVHCLECGCRTKLFECFGNTGKTHDDTKKEAIENWNQRFADNGKMITNKACTGERCPMQVGYDVKNCKDKDCLYRTETEKGGGE